MLQCSNCKVRRPADAFAGKIAGSITKRCQRCRDKDARQKQKPEVREKRNAMQRERQYHAAWRQKRRAEDEASFLNHNASVMRAWTSRNKARLSKWRTKNIAHRLGGIKSQARKKGLHFDLDDETCHRLMTDPCIYCGHLDLSASLNGIDRMDGSRECMYPRCRILRCDPAAGHAALPGRDITAWCNGALVLFVRLASPEAGLVGGARRPRVVVAVAEWDPRIPHRHVHGLLSPHLVWAHPGGRLRHALAPAR